MFSLHSIASRFRRDRLPTLLAGIGAGAGIGLIVTGTALSAGPGVSELEGFQAAAPGGADVLLRAPDAAEGGDAISIGEPSPADRRALEEFETCLREHGVEPPRGAEHGVEPPRGGPLPSPPHEAMPEALPACGELLPAPPAPPLPCRGPDSHAVPEN